MPDGCLIHLGGKDFQIKVRGYRVEVAEVETAVLALDVIDEAILILQSQANKAEQDDLDRMLTGLDALSEAQAEQHRADEDE